MGCIDEGLIQRYIDNEASGDEVEVVNTHIAKCRLCADRVKEQAQLSSMIKNKMDDIVESDISVPEFNPPVRVRSSFRRFIYTSSAAAVLIMAVIAYWRKPEPANGEMLYMQYTETEVDANLPATMQEYDVEVVDDEGNVTVLLME